jgi:hypothetical protein
MNHPETHRVTPENGPRPAGQPDECFYCHEAVGDDHKPTCVLRDRTVVMRYVFEVVIVVPEHWTKEDIEFHRNESTWCADNAVHVDLQRLAEGHCLCPNHTAEYVREATTEDEEGWQIAEMLK